MANFAQLDDNSVVLQVIAVNNDAVDNLPFPESEPIGVALCQSICGSNTIWKQTSRSSSFRKNYAASGYTYDLVMDAFIPPKIYPSWLLNTTTCQWQAPVPYPTDGDVYVWDEATLSWIFFAKPR
jgi:hypothetical protein